MNIFGVSFVPYCYTSCVKNIAQADGRILMQTANPSLGSSEYKTWAIQSLPTNFCIT